MTDRPTNQLLTVWTVYGIRDNTFTSLQYLSFFFLSQVRTPVNVCPAPVAGNGYDAEFIHVGAPFFVFLST